MQRRSFLKAVAMAVPAAGLQTFLVTQARAQTPALPPAPESCMSQVVTLSNIPKI